MAKSSIEWTEATWNPLTGCNKISPGCKHCYAERMSKRLERWAKRITRTVLDSRSMRICWSARSLEEAANHLRQFDERSVS